MSHRVSVTIKDHIADVQLSRPDKMNALDKEMFDAIISAGKQVSEDASVRVVVLSGQGPSFCAGLDLSNFTPNADGPTTSGLQERTHGLANMWQKAVYVWRECPVPVIVAAHGVVYGGGMQIISGADIKFITADARCSIMEMRWGLIPDMSGSQLWRHSVRDDILRELTYTHRVFSGSDAVDYGFATHVSAAPYEDALVLAKEIASKSPTAIVKTKKMFNQAPYLSVADGLMLESVEQEQVINKKNQLEAVYSQMQKRAGNFEDYRE